MFKKNEMVMYKKMVCQIKEIKEEKTNNEKYYVLIPTNDQSLKIQVPISNKCNNIKKIMTKEELKELIKQIPEISLIEVNDKQIEKEYKLLMDNGSHENLIKIIKTTYKRNKQREKDNKKISDKDNNYFKQAENYLYNELKITLDMTYEQTKKFIEQEVEKQIKC